MSGEATTIEAIVARILFAPFTDLELIFPLLAGQAERGTGSDR